MELIDFGIVALLAGLCIALVEMVKQVGIPERFVGVAALVIGIAVTLVAGQAGWTVGGFWHLILVGIMVGLIAAGLWSVPSVGVKSLTGR